LTKRIVRAATSLVGHIRGGLGYVSIMAILMFASLVGSAVASTAALGAILIPMMVKAGYNRDRSTALIAAGNLLSPIMPPSVPMIIFGVTGNVSIPKLFMSGIVPGLILACCLAASWAWIMRKEDFKPQPRKSFGELMRAARGAIWAFILPLIIIVGLRGGIFTPTEAASIACFYALFVGCVVYRELTLSKISVVLVGAAKTTSIIMFLAAGAMVSSWLMSVANIPAQVADMLAPFMGDKILLMFAINILVLLVGTAMDSTPTILILTPVLMPIVQKAGIDPIYFGFMFVFNNMIGLLTPPVGSVLNVAAGVGKVSMDNIIRCVMPYMWIEMILLLLLTFIPQIVTIPLGWFIGQ
jgi:tripartite ATP-independent transporter DctM subunit